MKDKINNIKEFFKNLDKKRKCLLIIILILILVLIGLLVFYFVTKDNKKEVKKPEKEKIEIVENYGYSNGNLIFYDNAKKELGKYACKNKDINLCYVAFLSNEDNFDIEKNINKDGKLVNRADIYNKQYAFVFDNAENEEIITLYDFVNEEKRGSYTIVKSYFDDLEKVVLKDINGKYGIVSLKETLSVVIDFEYDYLGIIKDDEVVVAKKNGNYFLINESGKNITKAIKEEIVNYNDNHLVAKNSEGKYMLYDYNATLITENYSFIELLDEYFLAVDESNKLMVLDYALNKYLGEGIQLKNKDYVKENVYDEELVKTETKYSYNYSILGTTLSIYVKNNDNEIEYTIDLNEGLYSKDLTYSYFDGKLYFYKDELKTELIGSYNCKNKNNIKDTIYNCYTSLKTSTNNNVLYDRYVVIFDSASTDTTVTKYYLYDFKENKLKGNFVEFFIDGDVNESISTSTINFFAVNKSSKTGIVKLSKDGIDNFIKIENDDVRRFENYYLIENSNKYILKDLNGIGIINTPFTYIELFDNYAVVANENILTMYDYTGKELIKNPVTINTKLYQFESYNIGSIYTITEKTSYYVIDNFTEKLYFSKTDGSSILEADALLLGE